ncbi:nucleotide sugar dehydrogenase [Streptomyces sp. SID5466]|nr:MULTISPECIES: nucleotide sugar dehydrogenase [Streptomyces]EFE78137.1 UDP-glucose/GDP-mannose dehydrogenase [Streptomyces filamentosus NRRL 15998]EWS95050.1 UDP-glucose/GDP-mannose dehydrogenase [Streptomyces filamentosus NRRL 11379]MYR82029.1 nucleotide sugar dehydrogenase [Streptomyces sp. SID5466]
MAKLLTAGDVPFSSARLSSVAVIGMGYVGLPTALGLHANGISVLGIDHDPHRLEAIRNQNVDLIGPDRERLATALGESGFELTTDVARLAEADAVMVCVPTPVDSRLLPDLGPLSDACDKLVRYARAGQTFILTSTSFIGTTATMLVGPLTDRGLTVGSDVFVASSPERIDPGNVRHTQQETPRVLGGVTPRCTDMAARVIEALSPSAHRVGSPEVAEMTKLYENTFRAVNIALANEFADICADLTLDPMEVIDAASTKPYGFMPFHPGPGVGGHCIPCDPHYLLWQLSETRTGAPLVRQAMNAIAERPRRVVERVQGVLSDNGKGMAGSRILVVGVSYKPGVRDVRSSPALEIIELLTRRGAKVGYYDPLIQRVALADGTVLESIVEPAGSDWDAALLHTVQPDHDYAWVHQCPMTVDATYRFSPSPAPC